MLKVLEGGMENLHTDDIIISVLWIEDEAVARELLGKVRLYTGKGRSKSKMIIPDSIYAKIKDRILGS